MPTRSPRSSSAGWRADRCTRRSRDAPKAPNPVALNDANLIAGIQLYAANCAICHGGADGNPSNVARGLYQKPPQLAKDGVEDDPEGETYWKINHGIRLTGMPSFGESLNDAQMWQLTLFLKHMDSLPPRPERLWATVEASMLRVRLHWRRRRRGEDILIG